MPYRKYYNLEHYLFEEVGPKFRNTGELAPLDFYFVLQWKANRAKNKTKDRLTKLAGSFDNATHRISNGIFTATSPKRQLELLMVDWGMRLPTATALLSVLFPEEFTIYDVRVCEQLQRFKEIVNWPFSEKLWHRYVEFKSAVHAAVPEEMTLRDKDRYLWGKSSYESAVKSFR